MRRVRKRGTRPLLQTADPVATMQALLEEREPIYAHADMTVCSRDASHDNVVEDVLNALETHLAVRDGGITSKEQSIKIGVDLPGRRYDIVIGDNLIAEAGALIAQVAPAAACAIVTDAHVAKHHLQTLQRGLDAAGLRHAAITVAPGEASKSFSTYERICDAILAARMERGDVVVALGGGVVGDSRIRRGNGAARHAPRASSDEPARPGRFLVGGKTGINSP